MPTVRSSYQSVDLSKVPTLARSYLCHVRNFALAAYVFFRHDSGFRFQHCGLLQKYGLMLPGACKKVMFHYGLPVVWMSWIADESVLSGDVVEKGGTTVFCEGAEWGFLGLGGGCCRWVYGL